MVFATHSEPAGGDPCRATKHDCRRRNPYVELDAGQDWTGTVWEPIYTDACRSDEVAAGLCFGLFVWEAFMDHPAAWSFGRYEKDGIPIQGMTYFRIHLNG